MQSSSVLFLLIWLCTRETSFFKPSGNLPTNVPYLSHPHFDHLRVCWAFDVATSCRRHVVNFLEVGFGAGTQVSLTQRWLIRGQCMPWMSARISPSYRFSFIFSIRSDYVADVPALFFDFCSRTCNVSWTRSKASLMSCLCNTSPTPYDYYDICPTFALKFWFIMIHSLPFKKLIIVTDFWSAFIVLIPMSSQLFYSTEHSKIRRSLFYNR